MSFQFCFSVLLHKLVRKLEMDKWIHFPHTECLPCAGYWCHVNGTLSLPSRGSLGGDRARWWYGGSQVLGGSERNIFPSLGRGSQKALCKWWHLNRVIKAQREQLARLGRGGIEWETAHILDRGPHLGTRRVPRRCLGRWIRMAWVKGLLWTHTRWVWRIRQGQSWKGLPRWH